VGDGADGYPGIPGWGAKSAAAVLSRCGHLSEIPITETNWRPELKNGERLAAALQANWDLALLFLKLATLRRDSILFGSVDELCWKGPRQDAGKIAERIGAALLLRRAEELSTRGGLRDSGDEARA